MSSSASAAAERESVRAVYDVSLTVGSVWYAVSSSWLEAWCAYVGIELATLRDVPPRSAAPPPPLDNATLRDPAFPQAETLRPGAIEGTDFELVPAAVAELLFSLYALPDTPRFRREVVSVGLMREPRIDLYPAFLTLVPLSETGEEKEDDARVAAFTASKTWREVRDELLAAAGREGEPASTEHKELEEKEELNERLRFWIAKAAKQAEEQKTESPSSSAAAAGSASSSAPFKSSAAMLKGGEGPLTENSALDLVTYPTVNAAATAPSSSSSSSSSSCFIPLPETASSSTASSSVPSSSSRASSQYQLITKDEMRSPLESFPLTPLCRVLLDYQRADGSWSRQTAERSFRDFEVGDSVDALDTVNKWYESIVKDCKGGKVLIHFKYWDTRWDEWLDVESERLAPLHSHTAPPSARLPPSSYSSPLSSFTDYSSPPYTFGSYNSNEEGRPEPSGAVGLRNLGNTCFDLRTEVLIRIGHRGDGQWMTAQTVMRYWSDLHCRSQMQIASLHAEAAAEAAAGEASGSRDRLAYSPLLHVVPPFVYGDKYGVDSHPVRIRTESSKGAAVDLLLTPDHWVWAAPNTRCAGSLHPYRRVRADQLTVNPLSAERGQLEEDWDGWRLKVAAPLPLSLHASVPACNGEFSFTLPSARGMLDVAASLGLELHVPHWLRQEADSAALAAFTFHGADMDVWLTLYGCHLAMRSVETDSAVEPELLMPQRSSCPSPDFLRTVTSRLERLRRADGSSPFIARVDDADGGCAEMGWSSAWTGQAAAQPCPWSVPVISLCLQVDGASRTAETLLPQWTSLLSPRQVRVLLQGMQHGQLQAFDGDNGFSATETADCCWCDSRHQAGAVTVMSRQHADQLHQLAMRAGLVSTMSARQRGRDCGLLPSSSSIQYVISLLDVDATCKTQSMLSSSCAVQTDRRPSTRQRRFWCVSTAAPSSVVLVRRRVSPQSADSSKLIAGRKRGRREAEGEQQQEEEEADGDGDEEAAVRAGDVWLPALVGQCFMNSILQSMAHAPVLTPHFLSGRYLSEINRQNPLGWNGRIAEEYGSLLRDYWSDRFSVVAPRDFKQALGEFQPRFSGYQQHDSSELLSFLLDGLHEDLNRVLKKPTTQPVDSAGRADEEVAAEAWSVFKLRNASVIVDNMMGQLKSRVVCPVQSCGRVSITFDPYCLLSLPLPTVNDHKQPVTVVFADPQRPITRFCLVTSKVAPMSELVASLAVAASVPASRLVLCDVWNNRIYRVLEEDGLVSDIKAADVILAYELPQLDSMRLQDALIVQVLQQRVEMDSSASLLYGSPYRQTLFGIPHIIPVSKKEMTTGRQLKQEVDRIMRGWITEEQQEEAAAVQATARQRPEGQPADELKAVQADAMETDELSPAAGATGGGAEAAELSGSQDSSYVLVSNPQDSIMTAGEGGETDAMLGEGESGEAEGQPPLQPQQPALTPAPAPASPSASTPYKIVVLDGEGRRCLRCPASRHCTGCPLPLDDETLDLPLSDASPYRSSSYAERELKLSLALEWTEQSMKRYRTDKETVDVSQSGECGSTASEAEGSSSSSSSSDQHRVHLSDCLSAFCKEEVLSEQDPWYCSSCKEFRCATKKMDLFSLPRILIIHLKRFAYTSRSREKISTYVDFPITGLDLSHLARDDAAASAASAASAAAPSAGSRSRYVYDLFAVSNHMGGLGGGHYTAYVRNRVSGRWFLHDDSRVSPAADDDVRSSAAYVLFYRARDITDEHSSAAAAGRGAGEGAGGKLRSVGEGGLEYMELADAALDADGLPVRGGRLIVDHFSSEGEAANAQHREATTTAGDRAVVAQVTQRLRLDGERE